MKDLRIFENPEFGKVRTVVDDNGEPWFVGKDVAEALGYSNTKDALARHVDAEDKLGSCFTTSGQNREMTVIAESGLYALIMSSKLATAKKFKRWVTSEVLPSIRKHGGYLTPEKLEAALDDPDTLIRLATSLKEERERRKALEQQAEVDRPKKIFADAVCASETSILVGELAKILHQNGINIGQKRLFERLRKDGFLIKRKGSDWNMPTQKSMEQKLFEIKETTITHADGHVHVSKTVKVTGKGQLYFVNHYLNEQKEADVESEQSSQQNDKKCS